MNIKKYFTKETEILKKNQNENLKLTNSLKWMYFLESTGNGADQMEKKISKLEAKGLEMIQEEEERELRYLKSGHNL